MNTQPEALRLANDLTALGGPLGNASAALLRTQHADIERKDALLRQAFARLEYFKHGPGWNFNDKEVLEALSKELQ